MIDDFSKKFLESVGNYMKSHNMSEADLLEMLSKHDEELAEEKINDLEDKIKGAVSRMSEKDLKNMIKETAKNGEEFSIVKSTNKHSVEPNKKDPVEVMFKDISGNSIKISFIFPEYFDKGVATPCIIPSFDYGPHIDLDMKSYLMKYHPHSQLLKEIDNETKLKLLTNLYRIIKDNLN